MATHRDIQARINKIPADLRLAVYLRDGNACVYCGKPRPYGVLFEADHYRAEVWNGPTEAGNLLCCCPACNKLKRELTPRAFFVFLEDLGMLTPGLQERVEAALATDIKPFMAQARALIEAGLWPETEANRPP